MEMSGWLLFILLIQVIHGICTWKLYIKANRKAWEAFVPVYNGFVMMQIINRPKWWILLLFIPIINLLLLPVIWIEILRTFGRKSTLDMWLGVLTLGLYIGYVNYTQSVTYEANRDTKSPTKTLDTLGSLSFAIIVATLVHSYLIQPFVIPTSSLEKSLLVGDFLFVSKYHYGARTPMTTVAAPMVHDSIPLIKTKSYLNKPQLPYFRFPGFQKIERNDIVVFNWPVDTVFQFRDALKRSTKKPIDKKSNYVKRCVGIAGDSIQIKNGIVFINGKELILPERAKVQYSYVVKVNPTDNFDYKSNILELNTQDKGFYNDNFMYFPALSDENLAKVKTFPGVVEAIRQIDTVNTIFSYEFKVNSKIEDKELDYIISKLKEQKSENGSEKFKILEKKESNLIYIDYIPKEIVDVIKAQKSIIYAKEINDIFPHSPKQKNWTKDNLGPIYIPQAGKTVALNLETLPFYKRIISDYEGKKLEIKDNQILIDNKPASSYTFEQDYYWMMGDNRHNSEDSRYWGFVPENHVVGKPVFIWMSWDSNASGLNKIRWDRVFTTVSGEGKPQSYFKYFLFLIGAYYAFDYFRNKKKKAAENE